MSGLVINPRTGRVDLSPADVAQAEAACLARSHYNMRFLKMDAHAAGNPADVAMGERVMAAAKSNPPEALRLMGFAAVNSLFSKGALFFSPN